MKRIYPEEDPFEEDRDPFEPDAADDLSASESGRKSGRGRRGRGFGTFLIVLGLLLLAGAAGLTIYNILDSSRAEKESTEIVEQLDEEIPDELEKPDDVENTLQRLEGTVPEMPSKPVGGYEYIGELEIPSLGLRLPVMAEWDYSRLRVSPCRFTGSYLTDDMVICAHNYPTHFGSIRGIQIGAEVDFISLDGMLYTYTVSNRETVGPTSVAQMIENDQNSDSEEDWDLTLFTCNLGGRTRCAVRCIRD